MKKHFQVLWVFLLLVVMYSFIGHMEQQQQEQVLAWQNSEQALQIEQEKLELDIIEAREELARFDEQLQAHNLLIWDIRERVHSDLEVELGK